MKLRVLGFRVAAKNLNVEQFFTKIGQTEDEFEFRGLSRILKTYKGKQLMLGLVLTIRDQKLFYELRRTKGTVHVGRREVGENGQDGLIEFNFFVVNPASGVGLYQSYHHAMSLSIFGAMLKSKYGTFRSEFPDQKLDRKLDFAPVMRQEEFESLLGELKAIHSMRFHLASVNDQAGHNGFGALGPVAKTITQHVTFNKGAVQNLFQPILSAINSGRLLKPTIYGRDADGLDIALHLEDNLSRFVEHDFNDFMTGTDIDISTFQTHKVAIELAALMKDHGL